MKRAGRNDPCPCGSGRKFKQCCGGLAPSLDSDGALEHWNLGNALKNQGRLQEAVACYRQALLLTPESAHIHYNLGNALRDQGKLAEALGCYRAALSWQPDMAEAFNNMGIAYQALRRPDDALAAYRKALALRPTYAEACYNLGTALREFGEVEEAIAAYRQALALMPNLVQAHHELGNALCELGQRAAALASYREALARDETPELKASFAHCIRGMDFAGIDPALRRLVVRALSEPWARPTDLAALAVRLVKLDPCLRECIARASRAWPTRLTAGELFGPSELAALASDPLLLSLLQGSPVPDVALERFLTLARSALLDAAISGNALDEPPDDALTFYCALARQCFINDFVFSSTDEELDRASLLRDRLIVALEGGAPVPALWVVAVGAYVPLLSLPASQSMLDRPWPEAVSALLAQHIVEPLQELQYRGAMPRLTRVGDDVSRSVRQQYEEHPYPRWVKLPPTGKALSLEGYLRRNFPWARWSPFDPGDGVDILVAGCGTGREPIELARQFAGARVLAVDLSLASLCHARRKTAELGLRNIQYAEADIVHLESIGRTFDLIASVGVLHHLADPVEGLRKLLSLLRPGGFMLLGLYSESGRRSVAAARRLIAERGYGPSATDIRRCRQELMSMDPSAVPGKVTSFSDFYVTSECRDLLFHVREHRFTLPRIRALLTGSGLDLVGFVVEPRLMNEYRERFPDDPSATNLEHWNDFETRFPDAFAGMYVFLVQKSRGD